MTAARSDPKGAFVDFDISSARPITHVEIDLIGDGEPPFKVDLPYDRSDGRYFRGMRWKPTINGTFPLIVTAVDSAGCEGHSFGAQSVTVIF